MKYTIVDIKINFRFKALGAAFKAFFSIENLTNKKYAVNGGGTGTFGSVYVMPGRTISGGLEARF